IQNLLEQAKQNSVIKPEEPLDDFDHVQQILGKDSPFLVEVKKFEDTNIISYPLQNLQNRSQVYAIDAIWGSGKSTFIKLVESLVTKKEEFRFRDKKTTPSADAATPQEGNFTKNPLQAFLQWADLGFRQGKNEVIWIDFNPWNYITSEKLIVDFFDTLENRIS
ncbi:MAG: P-loop NTPase fold protein, partial [Dolichospermum sp.]